MAERQLIVFAKVKDGATAPLKDIETGFKKTSKAIGDTGMNLTQFNKTMFSATAFIGFFSKAIGSLGNSLSIAGDLDRLSNQFERVVGPKGELFKQISGMTKNTIDNMEAMRAGIALKSTGIVSNVNQIAGIIAKAGTAGKRAGLNSAEGIKQVTNFMKDGSVAHLSFLNVLTPTNAGLQAQMAILNKAGGVMGGVISTQARLKIGMAALDAASRNMGSDTADLADILQDVGQKFEYLKASAFGLLGKALSPLITKITDLAQTTTDFLDRISKDEVLRKTIKNIVIVTSAMAGLLAVVGSLSLAAKALGSFGLGGLPMLAGLVLGLGVAFGDAEASAEPFITFFKQAGAVMTGVFQLVSSFLGDSDNFSKGIGKMDSKLAEFLQKNGLLELVRNIATVSTTIIKFTQDTGQQLIDWFNYATNAIKPFTDKMQELFTGDHKNWARSWIEGGEGLRGKVIQITAAIAGLYGGFKLAGMAKGLLSKIPVIGGLFGSSDDKTKGPKGTSQDPVHVVMPNSSSAGLISGAIQAATNPTTVASEVVTTSKFAALIPAISGLIGPFNTVVLGAVALAASFYALDYLLGGALTNTIGKLVDYIAGFFDVKGSSANIERQEAIYKSPEYKQVLLIAKRLGQPTDSETIARMTKGVIANSSQLAAKKQLELDSKGSIYERMTKPQGDDYVISQEAENYGYENALENLKQGIMLNTKAKYELSPYAKAMSIIGFKRDNTTGEALTPMPNSQEQVVSDLQDVMAGIDKQSQKRVSAAWTEAVKGTSAGGSEITLEEWQAMMTAALDQSLITKHTKKAAEDKKETIITKSRC